MSPKTAGASSERTTLSHSGDLQTLADDRLLARFYQSHDDAAFGVLVARHGPLVLGVCQRILGNASDAEDAFQATFLVLVRKGATLRQPENLASWLYGVAHRTARNLKAKAALRSKRESEASEMPRPSELSDMTYRELAAILDEEISKLPPKYKLPLLLCYLEGKTNAQAASQLGWPEGSMSRRLSRARELLRSRLAKRGLTLSAALLVAAFSRPASASVPSQLVDSTVDAASRVLQDESPIEDLDPTAEEILDTPAAKRPIPLAFAVGALVIAVVMLGWQLGTPAIAAQFLNGGKDWSSVTGWWSHSAASPQSSSACGGHPTGCATEGACMAAH